MNTRSITTTQPAVACDVCGRTLLRGEQADAFVVSGQRRMVCELCVSRATNEGWRRESDGAEMSVRPARRRRGRGRGRGLMGRLRDLREPEALELEDEFEPAFPEDLVDDSVAPVEHDESWELPVAEAPVEPVGPAVPPPVAPAPVPAVPHAEPRRSPRHVRGVPTNSGLRAARALEVFNRGEEPRRVAGVARSLGPPWVAVRALAPAGGAVSITVAWELCWYRYEVDLTDEDAHASLVAQGMELAELSQADREANAQADERGELHMAQAPAESLDAP